MKLDELRAVAEGLAPGSSLTVTREALLDALSTSHPTPQSANPEHWLTADDVASRLGVSRRYVYARRATFPFTRQLPGVGIRFSERGLDAWMSRVR